MKLSIWHRPGTPESIEGERGDGRYSTCHFGVIEDEDTGTLFVPLDGDLALAAADAMSAARGTPAEDAVLQLIYAMAPGVNGPTADAWLSAAGLTARERLVAFGVL